MRASWRLIWLCFLRNIPTIAAYIIHHCCYHCYHQGRPHHWHDLKITCLWSANSTSHKPICFNTCLWTGTGLLQGTGLFANFYGIAKNCKFGIEQEEWEKIIKELNLVWKSDMKELFDSNWQAFKSANRLPPLAIDYIEKEWISRQIHFAHY